MKIVLLADACSAVGDRADGHAAADAVVRQLGSRVALEVMAITSEPELSIAERAWTTVPRLGFAGLPASDAHRDVRLRAVLDAARGDTNALPWSDQAWKVIHAVDAADAVVIAGSVELSSARPEQVYECAALALLAGLFSKRHVVTGPVLGELTARHSELVEGLITTASLVATAVPSSFDAALRCGVAPERLVRAVDVVALPGSDEDDAVTPAGAYIAAAFSNESGLLEPDVYVTAVAALADAAADASGLPIVLVPSAAAGGEPGASSDLALHEKIAGAMRADARVLGACSDQQLRGVTQHADLVISSRYLPIAVALGASVPVLGVSADVRDWPRIVGGMEAFGLDDFALSSASLLDGGAELAVRDALARGTGMRAHLESANVIHRAQSAQWWDTAVEVLGGGDAPTSVSRVWPDEQFQGGEWTVASRALRAWSDRVVGEVAARQREAESGRAEIERLHDEVVGLEREIASGTAELAASADEVDALRESVKAAYKLVSEEFSPVAVWFDGRPTIDALQAELDRVYSTRTFRYMAGLRRLYGRLRK
jgi:hypothetical protein